MPIGAICTAAPKVEPFNAFLSFLGKRFEPINVDNAYKVIMKLTINSVSQNDFGSYRCVSKNSLGDTDGSIKLYREYKK